MGGMYHLQIKTPTLVLILGVKTHLRLEQIKFILAGSLFNKWFMHGSHISSHLRKFLERIRRITNLYLHVIACIQ